jgi:hypothetical protein
MEDPAPSPTQVPDLEEPVQHVVVQRNLLLALGEIAEVQKALALALLTPPSENRVAQVGGAVAGLLRAVERLGGAPSKLLPASFIQPPKER